MRKVSKLLFLNDLGKPPPHPRLQLVDITVNECNLLKLKIIQGLPCGSRAGPMLTMQGPRDCVAGSVGLLRVRELRSHMKRVAKINDSA